jgi:23S rRNA pseudouridine2457 synthase
VLIAFHKPYGVISQFRPEGGWRTLAEFGLPPRVRPAGRLDADSEGLLLLTDDGALQHRLCDPRFEHTKTYWAQVEGAPTDADLEPLRGGIAIRDYVTRPAAVRLLDPAPELPPRDPPIRTRKHIPDRWIELVLHEGRNRQVRRMTAAVGFPTLRLVRVAIGEIGLDALAPGQWCETPVQRTRSRGR